MYTSLRTRLLLTLISTAVLAAVVVTLFANRGTTNEFNQYVDRNFIRERQVVAIMLEQRLQHEGIQGAQLLAEALAQANGRPIALINDEGVIIAASSPEWIGQMARVHEAVPDSSPLPFINLPRPNNQPQLFTFRLGPGQRVEFGRFLPPGTVGDPPAISALTIETVTEQTISSLPPEEQAQQFLGSVNRSFILAALTAVALAGALALALSRRIVRPVEALTAAAREMEKGDLSQRVKVSGGDEIGKLAHAFNSMADGLAQTEQLRRTMVSDIAHELRTPLTNIRGYLEAVQDGVITADAATIGSLHEEAMLLTQLVDDLQELSLAEAGQLRLDIQPADINSILETAVTSSLPQANGKQIEMTLAAAANAPPILADPGRVGQVLRNLLSNALTHTPEKGRVQVTAVPLSDAVQITVQDSGPGIPPEHLPYIFDRFYRADPSRNRATGGSGLGLAIAKTLIEGQNGRIWAESPPDAGAVFHFTLPTTGDNDA